MLDMLEQLEGRTLFAATAATILAGVGAVRADVTALEADLQADRGTVGVDAVALRADAAALPKTAANRRLVAKLRAGEAALAGRLTAAGRKAASLATVKTEQRLVADGTAVVLDPSDAAARSKLVADVKRVQAAAAGPIAKVEATFATGPATLAADLAALVLANPTDAALSADAGRAASGVSAAAAAADPQLTQTRADLALLLADLAA